MAETKASVPNAGDRDAAWRDVLATTLRRRERAWTRIVSETERRALTERALAAMRLTGTKDTAIEALVRVLEEAEQCRSLGGLCVIGTERHEARRIDNQLRGRSG